MEPFESTLQQRDLRRGGALLGSEHLGGVDEQGGDVAGDEQLDAAQARRGVDRPERAESAVGRRRPAETDDDAGRSTVERAIDQLADAGGGGPHRVVAVGSTGEHEPARPRHLDDRRAAVQPPVGLDSVAERTGHDVATVGPAEHVEESFPAVGQGDLLAVVPQLPTRVADRGRDVGGRGRAPELVDRGHDPHRRRRYRARHT